MDNQQLTAKPEVIRQNIERLWGTISGASKATGINRQTLYNIIEAGEITDWVTGRIYKLGIEPKELIRIIKKSPGDSPGDN